MPTRGYLSGIVVLALAAASSAKAEESLVLTPAGVWNVEYAPESCVLARAFGKPEAPVYLRMEQFAPGAQFQVSLVGSTITSRNVTADVQVRFHRDPGADPITVSALFGSTNDKLPAFNFPLSLREAAGGDMSDERELSSTEISALSDLHVASAPGGDAVVLKMGTLTQPLGVLKVCMDKLVSQWGVDPGQQSSLSRRPQPINPGKWIRPEDYPKAGLHAGQSAAVHFRVTVDEGGRVANCAVQSATEGAQFARKTCTLISRRARFKPALDADGRAVGSYYASTLRWLLQSDRNSSATKVAQDMLNDL